MTYIDEEKKPEVASGRNVAAAVVLHILLFAALWFFGQLELVKKELVIPIELTVVVDTPPPPPKEEKKPVEEKPKPPKPPPKKEDPPKPKEAVEQIQVKTNKIVKVDKPKEEKPKEEKKPEAPKKTAAELREIRYKAMRDSAKDVTVKANPPKEKPPPDFKELLAAGYKPSETNQIASNEVSRCTKILTNALDDKWREISPQTGAPGFVHITITFSRGGAIARHSLAKSSGDRLSDAAAMKVVGSLGTLRGLSAAFLEKYSKESITIRYKIESSR